jgi:hypothetical protein
MVVPGSQSVNIFRIIVTEHRITGRDGSSSDISGIIEYSAILSALNCIVGQNWGS